MTTTTTTLTQNGQTAQIGDYGFLVTDLFTSNQASSITYGPQNGLGVSNVTITNTYPNSQPPSGWDWGFSGIFWGSNGGAAIASGTPPISGIQHLVVNYSTILTGAPGANYDEIFDINASHAGGLIDNEISIYSSQWASTPHPTGTPFSLGGITGNFVSIPEPAPGPAFAANAVEDQFFITSPMTSGTFDIAPLLQYLIKLALVSPAETLSGLQLDTEVDVGSNTLTVNSFNVFETVTTPIAVNEGASASGQVFSITTNNNYAIYGNGFSNTSVAINSSFTNFSFTQHAITAASQFTTTITLSIHGSYTPGTSYSFDVHANGQDLGTHTLSTANGIFSYQGAQYTSDQTFTFMLNGLTALTNFQITSNSSAANLWLDSVSVNGLSLGAYNTSTAAIDRWIGANETIDASVWNNTLAAQQAAGEVDLSASGYGSIATASIGTFQFNDATITDAANILTLNLAAGTASSDLGTIQQLVSSKEISAVALTDAGIPTISVTAAQLANDSAALKDISGYYTVSVTAPTTSATITGQAGHGNVVVFSGTAASYAITPTADGSSFTITNGTIADHLNNVTALQFSDSTDIVASQTPIVAGGISSSEITSLYAAVFGRLPDVAGLDYYENTAAANPALAITTYAEWFLQSPEYTGNSAHNYAQTVAGDAQFITDTYNNLLHRDPGAGDVAWYQTNVINPILNGLTAGTAAYTIAEILAHAALLADFSQSAEFLGDVQINAQHPASVSHWLLLV